jgi:hypothetical protein
VATNQSQKSMNSDSGSKKQKKQSITLLEVQRLPPTNPLDPKEFKIKRPSKEEKRMAVTKSAKQRHLEMEASVKEKNDKELLGELFEDKKYLQEFIKNENSSIF